jgi:phage tail sheath gpL-like
VQNQLLVNAMTSKLHVECLRNILNAIEGGVRNALITTVIDDGNATLSTGIITLTGVVAGDQLLLNGYVFQAVASGATGNQFNIGGTDILTAAAMASAINASVTVGVNGLFTATSALTVVTITSLTVGAAGNNYDLESRGSGSVVVTGAGAQASGLLTCATAGAATDTLTVNGITFTAVASGAVGNQYNVGGTTTLTATAIALSINTSVTAGVLNYVYASSSGAVVTIRASRVGIFGNEFTLLAGQASITVSGSRLTGGTDSAVVNFSGGGGPSNAKSVSYKYGL